MKKRQIFIELTPLLDVILIMIFVLLVQSKAQVEASETAVRDAVSEQALTQKELNDTKKELAEVKRRELSLGLVEENSYLITMSIDASSVHQLVMDADGGQFLVSLDESRLSTAAGRIKDVLVDLITATDQETIFLVFQYDRNSIYHQEYEAVSQAIEELKPAMAESGYYVNYIEVDVSESGK